MHTLTFVFALLLTAIPALASPPRYEPSETPTSLRAWEAWVLAKSPNLSCAPVLGTGEPHCRWPGLLKIEADRTQGSFELLVRMDREGRIVLPGGDGAWPDRVSITSEPGSKSPSGAAPVLDQAGQPYVDLRPGRYQIRGEIPWLSRPSSLRVPSDVGVLSLVVDGQPVAHPNLSPEGSLRLAESEPSATTDSRVELDVVRLIEDGVPVIVTTQLQIRASGAPREIDLGLVAVDQTVPITLDADLPARFDADGSLIVLARPGSWTVTFKARHEGPVTSLTAPSLGEPWPPVEYWVWSPSDRIRAATPAGPPGIDPSRAPIPDEWTARATYRVTPDTPLTLEELRRGEPEPAPSEIYLSREMWLDLGGGGLTVRDRFSGEQRRDWRLQASDGLILGNATAGDDDQVITVDEAGRRGVELRASQLDLHAESRIEPFSSTLGAVGWATEVQSLDARLHLPPGWQMVAALGVDQVGASGTMVSQWTLWDLFFVLIVGLAVGKVIGWRWGVVTLIALTLGRHEAGAPAWTWAMLVTVIALARAVPWRWARLTGRWSTWVLLVILAFILVPWGVQHLQESIWPGTRDRGAISTIDAVTSTERSARSFDARSFAPPMEQAPMDYDEPRKERFGKLDKLSGLQSLSSQYDPGAQIQTGPGVPSWSWDQVQLRWSGSVPADHRIRLILLSPWQTALLAWLRVALFLVLGFAFAGAARRLSRPTDEGGEPSGTAGATKAAVTAGLVLVAFSLASPRASASEPFPPRDLLNDLEQRMNKPPGCLPSCLTASNVYLSLRDGRLTLRAELHAQVDSSWPLPGPATAWAPASVLIDGRPADVTRLSDGHLHARVPAGRQTLVITGPAPAEDSLNLTWGLRPKRLSFDTPGWSVEGRRADGSAEAFVQLTRVVRDGAEESQRSEDLAPWVEIERFIDLGVPWRVQTTVRRLGPHSQPLALRVPLLPGESITDAEYEGEGGERLVTLARGRSEVSWTSNLASTPTLSMTAPRGVPWTEHWRVSCSPVFSCQFSGPPPLHHTTDGRWQPSWRPWPGEEVTIAVERPEAADGPTTTIDRASLVLTPGRRQLAAVLSLSVRNSQGGTQILTLPPDSRLTRASIGGTPQPLQLRDDGTIHVPLQPGHQEVELRFLQEIPTGSWFQTPPVDLGTAAVNVRVDIKAPEERWILGLFGPSWGPVPLYLVYLVLVGVGAAVLSRLPNNPLAVWQWVLLGLGMTQVPVVVPLIVAFWLFAFAWRARRWPENPWIFNLVQLGLIGTTLVALACLYAAVHAGLLFQPDMQVTGNGSTNTMFRWYSDRIDGLMPRPSVVSLPLWVFRVFMLVWSLWLAASLIGWLRRGGKALGQGGWVKRPPLIDELMGRKKPNRPTPSPSTDPAQAEPDTDPG